MDKVLIVDDDESVLMLMSSALERAGYDVRAEESAIQALAAISSERILVAVSDIMMPEMDGLTLLTKIKEKSPDCLVIFITANASIDSAVFALKEGAFAYLRKPFNPDELVVAVKSAFTKIHLLEQNKKFVTELKAARDYNETILRNLTYTVIAVDVEGKIKKLNHAMEKLLGYREEELLGQSIETIFAREFIERGWPLLLGGGEIKEFSLQFKRKDGGLVSQIFQGKVMRDADGKVAGFLGTCQNGELG